MGEGLEIRYDLIGVLSVFGDDGGRAFGRLAAGDARDVRLRVAVVIPTAPRVEALLREVTASILAARPAAVAFGPRSHRG